MKIKKISTPEQLCNEWDILAGDSYLKRSFLSHIHTYNFCNQRYYELYHSNRFVAGTIVYTLKINFFTFSKLKLILPMHVIGIPVSIASEPLVGNNSYADNLLLKILKEEKGLILGLNFKKDYCIDKVLNLRTLPTVILENEFKDSFEFLDMMRHPYRRKLKLHAAKFREVTTTESSCGKFTPEHLQLYLNIMKKTATKLEVLTLDFFQNLPSNFILTTHSFRDIMLAWQICAIDNNNLFFFFGEINYDKRDEFSSYYNNLFSIVRYAIQHKYKIIDFGQTAELVKLRFGGKYSERRMFLYHQNWVIRLIFNLFRRFLTYADKQNIPAVFKEEMTGYSKNK